MTRDEALPAAGFSKSFEVLQEDGKGEKKASFELCLSLLKFFFFLDSNRLTSGLANL